MGNKIVTEADRKFTKPLPTPPGVTLPTGGRGLELLSKQMAAENQTNHLACRDAAFGRSQHDVTGDGERIALGLVGGDLDLGHVEVQIQLI